MKICSLMHKITFFLFAASFSCTRPPSPHVKAAENLILSYSKEVKESHNLVLADYGGLLMTNIKTLDVIFFSTQHLDIEQARKILVDTVEYLLNKINTNEILTHYLYEIPFTYKLLSFSIIFIDQNNNNSYILPPHLSEVMLTNGLVFYDIYEADKDAEELIYSESYLKAKGIVEHQRNLEKVSWAE